MRSAWEKEAEFQDNVRKLREMQSRTALKGWAILMMFLVAAFTLSAIGVMLPYMFK